MFQIYPQVSAPVFSKISGDHSLVVVLEHSGVLVRLELIMDFFSTDVYKEYLVNSKLLVEIVLCINAY